MPRFFSKIEMLGQFAAEKINQLRVHKNEVVGNPERDDRLVADFFNELFAQAIGMFTFHAKNHICPSDMAVRDFDAGAIGRSCTAGGVARMVFEQCLRGRTAPLVARTDEKQFGFHAEHFDGGQLR